MGEIYYKIYKHDDKAKEYLYDSVTKVHLEVNAHLCTKKWFVEAKKYLEEIQIKYDDIKKEFKEKYDKDLQEIESKFDKVSTKKFLKYIEENYKSQ